MTILLHIVVIRMRNILLKLLFNCVLKCQIALLTEDKHFQVIHFMVIVGETLHMYGNPIFGHFIVADQRFD